MRAAPEVRNSEFVVGWILAGTVLHASGSDEDKVFVYQRQHIVDGLAIVAVYAAHADERSAQTVLGWGEVHTVC